MAQRRDRRRGTLLEALPAGLRREASPEGCWCRYCEPVLTDVERAARVATERKWHAARKAWCAANGYRLLDLLRAERGRAAPSKRKRTNSTRPTRQTPAANQPKEKE